MKNISIALSGLSLAAVAVLYYLHFFSATPTKEVIERSEKKETVSIAYVNSDSVLKYYDYYKEVRSRFEAKGKKLDRDLQNRAQALQNEITAYQRNLSSMTIGQAKAAEEDLGRKQQNFRVYQQSIEQELMTEQSKVNAELYTNITTFLKTYGAAHKLQAVFKLDSSSDLLYGNEAIDISQEVIKGLNEEYKQKQKAKPDLSNTKK